MLYLFLPPFILWLLSSWAYKTIFELLHTGYSPFLQQIMFPVLQGTVSPTKLGTFAKPAIRKHRSDLAESFTVVETHGRLCCGDCRPCFRVQPCHTHTQGYKPPLFSQSMTVQLDATENIILLSATFLSIFKKNSIFSPCQHHWSLSNFLALFQLCCTNIM